MITYDDSQEPIILPKPTLDLFLAQPKPAELIALYTFYYYTAKWQKTNCPKCNSAYVAKGLHWNEEKVQRVKNELMALGLVENKKNTREDGTIAGWYIQLNFIWSREKVDEILKNQHELDSVTTAPRNLGGGERGAINTLSSNRINALSSDKNPPIIPREPSAAPPTINRRVRRPVRPTQPTIPFLDKFPKPYQQSKHFQQIWEDYVGHRKENERSFKAKLTERAVNILVGKVEKNYPTEEGIPVVIERFEWCISNGKIAPNLDYWEPRYQSSHRMAAPPPPSLPGRRRPNSILIDPDQLPPEPEDEFWSIHPR